MHLHNKIATPGKIAVVSGHQQGDAFVGNKVKQKFHHHDAVLFIERAGGFVGQQDFGAVHQCAAEGGALAFPAREFLDAMAEAMGEPGALCQFVQAGLGDAAIGSRGNRWNEAVLRKREIWNQIVELKNETDFMPEQAKQVAMAIYLSAVD